ncbi:MAG: hypothetical protein U9O94_09410 [Nanoarchaeota archaeon]|nr:hypothetical protein [Nanoarchaeota archaeon]
MAENINLKEVKRVFSKILQAYRMRLNLMQRRSEVLKEFLGFHNVDDYTRYRVNKQEIISVSKRKESIGNSLRIKKSLGIILKKEKKILDIILEEDDRGENNIEIAFKILDKYHEYFEENSPRSPIKGILRKYNIEAKDVLNAAHNALIFLHKLDADIRRIEKRIELEEIFMEDTDDANPNKDKLYNFARAWQEEIYANYKLMNHIKKIFTKSKKVRLKGDQEDNIFGAIVGGTFMGVKGMNYVANANRGGEHQISEEVTSLLGGFGVLILFASMVGAIYNYSKRYKNVYIDSESAIKEFTKNELTKTPKKIHWWRKIF